MYTFYTSVSAAVLDGFAPLTATERELMTEHCHSQMYHVSAFPAVGRNNEMLNQTGLQL
jgi:hypothetical protein